MYQLNPSLAEKADTIGAYITETGKYTGKFIRAEKLVSSNKGTHGIGFTFQADDGRETRFDVWTMNAAEEPLSGLNQINAMMACLQQRSLEVGVVNVKKWHDGQEQIMAAECFPALMNKQIGLLLHSEEYEKMKDGHKTGDTAWRIGLFAVFQFGTELMASEIMKRKTTPEQLAKVSAMLADKPIPAKKRSAAPAAAGRQSQSMSMDDFDSIPF